MVDTTTRGWWANHRAIVLAAGFASAFASGTTAQVAITGSPSCSECAIRVTERSPLGARGDSVGIGAQARVALGSGGRVYAISDFVPTSGALAFDADGALSAVVGREGEGPGELARAWRIAASRTGELFVQDVSGRIQVFGPDGRFRRTLAGIVRSVRDLAVVGDSLIVVSGQSRPPEYPDRPVHLYSATSGQLIAGIGPRSELRPGRPSGVVAVADAGRDSVWLVEASNRVSLWTLGGERVRTYEWQPDWLRLVNPAYRSIRADEEYVLHDVWQQPGSGLLWLLSVIRDPAADVQLPPTSGPFPRDYFNPRQWDTRHNTILTVLDPLAGVVLTNTELEEAAYQFLRDGRIVLMREADDGHQWIELVRMRLTGAR